jgi:hypothetical protein
VLGPWQFRRGSKDYGWAGARLGVAMLAQRFTSDTQNGNLPNYEAFSAGLGAQLNGGYLRAVGKYFRFGAEGSYFFGGVSGYRAPPNYLNSDGSRIILDTAVHVLDVRLIGALHFDAIGGIDVRLKLGGELQFNRISKNRFALLPDDNVYGMTIGLQLAFPNLARIANRPFGVHLFGGGLVPAYRQQSTTLREGIHDSTYGAFFGLGMSFTIWKYLALELDYSYSFAKTHLTGTAAPNRGISNLLADRGNSIQFISLGLGFHY